MRYAICERTGTGIPGAGDPFRPDITIRSDAFAGSAAHELHNGTFLVVYNGDVEHLNGLLLDGVTQTGEIPTELVAKIATRLGIPRGMVRGRTLGELLEYLIETEKGEQIKPTRTRDGYRKRVVLGTGLNQSEHVLLDRPVD